MGARAWPFGGLCPGPVCLGCGTRFAQTVLAPTLGSGPGRSHARWRPEVAPWDGAGTNARGKEGGPHEMRPLQVKTKARRWIPDY